MNLGDRAEVVEKLAGIFMLLEKFWYGDRKKDPERWFKIRIGSVSVYLDEGNQLHLDFTTRFHFENSSEFLKVLSHFKD